MQRPPPLLSNRSLLSGRTSWTWSLLTLPAEFSVRVLQEDGSQLIHIHFAEVTTCQILSNSTARCGAVSSLNSSNPLFSSQMLTCSQVLYGLGNSTNIQKGNISGASTGITVFNASLATNSGYASAISALPTLLPSILSSKNADVAAASVSSDVASITASLSSLY